MYALQYFVYLCVFSIPTVFAFRTKASDEADITLEHEGEIVKIACDNEALARCELEYPNGTRIFVVSRCLSTDQLIFASEDCKLTISFGFGEHDGQETIHGTEQQLGTDADDGPIVISVQTYVCANLAFLATFVALVYCKERYYTLYYGKTWGDKDSIHSCSTDTTLPEDTNSANPLLLV